MSFEEECSEGNLLPSTIIDEEPELKTNVEFTEIVDGDCLTKLMKKFTKGYKTQTIIAMSCSTFGLVSLMLPLSLKLCGLVPTILIYIVTYACSLFTMLMLLEIILKTNALNYHQLTYSYIGRKWAMVYDIFNLLYQFFVLVLYQLFSHKIIKNLIIKFWDVKLEENYLADFFISGIPLLLYLPITQMTRFLKVTSLSIIVSAVLVVYLIMMIICLFLKKYSGGPLNIFEGNAIHYLYGYGLFTAVFGSHSNLFDNLSQFMLKTAKRATSVVLWSQVIQFVFFIFFIFLGFFLNPEKNDYSLIILNINFIPIIIVKILIVLLLTFLIPLQVNLVKDGLKNFTIKSSPVQKPFPVVIDLLIGLILLLIGGIILYFVNEPLKYIAIIGGICCSVICYFFPVYGYLVIFKEKTYKHYIGYIIIIFNVFLGATLTFYGSYKLLRSK